MPPTRHKEDTALLIAELAEFVTDSISLASTYEISIFVLICPINPINLTKATMITA